jgi:hypothetical protein
VSLQVTGATRHIITVATAAPSRFLPIMLDSSRPPNTPHHDLSPSQPPRERASLSWNPFRRHAAAACVSDPLASRLQHPHPTCTITPPIALSAQRRLGVASISSIHSRLHRQFTRHGLLARRSFPLTLSPRYQGDIAERPARVRCRTFLRRFAVW